MGIREKVDRRNHVMAADAIEREVVGRQKMINPLI